MTVQSQQFLASRPAVAFEGITRRKLILEEKIAKLKINFIKVGSSTVRKPKFFTPGLKFEFSIQISPQIRNHIRGKCFKASIS